MLENLTAVIPYRNGQATIDKLLDSLPEGLPVLIVDDQSAQAYQTTRPNVRVIRMQQRGYFAGACNAGIAACETDVLILNQDVWLEGSAWQELLAYRQTYAMGGDKVARHRAFPMGYVQGTFMWLRRDAIQKLGTTFDQINYPLWGCTALTQLRLSRIGFQVLPIAMAEHGMRHARGDKPYGSSIEATLQAEPGQQQRLLRTPPAISVVITCYNYAKFLPEAVASLVGGRTAFGELPPQTFQSFEVVLVDDASTDESAAVGLALADPWKLIRFYKAPQNLGSAAAANLGIKHSFGRYVTVLDADDMMHETRLEKLYNLAIENAHALVYDDCLEVAADRKTLLHARPQNADGVTEYRGLHAIPLRLPDYNFEKMLLRNGIHKGIFIERAAWEETGGYPEEFNAGREDWAFNIALGSRGYCGVHLKEPLYLRRQHGGNRHLRNTNPFWRERFMTQLHTRYPELYAGERTTMCCGNKGTVKSNGGGAGVQTLKASGRFSMSATQTPSDMVLLEYLLQKSGTRTYVGQVTHRSYIFGGQRKQGYVDARDADSLLSMIENHQPAFRKVEVTVQKAETPAPIAVQPVVQELLQQSEARVAAWQTAEQQVEPADQAVAKPAPEKKAAAKKASSSKKKS